MLFVQEFLRRFCFAYQISYVSETYTATRPYVKCADGYTISIQAGEGLYSRPRSVLLSGMYSAVELGFPNQYDADLDPYVEGLYASVGKNLIRMPEESAGFLDRRGVAYTRSTDPQTGEPFLIALHQETSVFPYTPVEVIEKVLAKHGGVVAFAGWDSLEQWYEKLCQRESTDRRVINDCKTIMLPLAEIWQSVYSAKESGGKHVSRS